MVDNQYIGLSEEVADEPEERWHEIAAARQKLLELEEMRSKFRDQFARLTLLSIGCLGLLYIGFTLPFDRGLMGSPGNVSVASLFIGFFALCANATQLFMLRWELKRSAQLKSLLTEAVYEASSKPPAYTSMERG